MKTTLREERLDLAGRMLAAMIQSPAVVDRSTVDKKRWAGVALGFADALIRAVDNPSPPVV